MAKTTKLEDKIEENTPETAEKQYCFWDDPYLTEEQKNLLIDHEMTKMLASVRIQAGVQGPYTLLRYVRNGVQPEYTYYLVNAIGSGLKTAWEYYQSHVQDPSVAGFVTLVTKVLGRENVVYKEVTLLDLE